jgi:hypothetical protein
LECLCLVPEIPELNEENPLYRIVNAIQQFILEALAGLKTKTAETGLEGHLPTNPLHRSWKASFVSLSSRLTLS